MTNLIKANNNLLKLFKKNLVFINIGLIIFLLSPLFLLINNQLSQEIFNIDDSSKNNIFEGCGINIVSDTNYKIDETLSTKDVYIFPELNNFKCLGVPVEIIYSFSENKIVANYALGSNYKAFKYINLLGNYVLIFLILVNLRKYIPHIILLYFMFNFGIYKLFIPIEPITEIILPVAPFEIGDQFIKFFVNNLFLIAVALKLDKKNLYLSLFIYFVFVSIDYLGLFIFLLFFKNKFDFNFSEKQDKLFLSIPILFYSVRIVSGIFTYFDDIWINLGQTIYRGYTRYADSQRLLFFIKCNGNPDAKITEGYFLDIQCAAHGGGPLDTILRFNGDVNTWSKILGTLTTFLLILIYLKCVKYFKNYRVFLPIFFLSPPLVHLSHYGNDDFIILLISLYALWDIRKNTLFKLFLILLISLFNLHPTSILIGIAVVAVKKSNYKVFINTFVLLIIFSILFFWDLFYNSAHIALMPWHDYGFGIYLDILTLERFFSIPGILGFIIIILFIVTILNSNSFKLIYSEVDFKKIIQSGEKFKLKYDEYAIFGISFWYLITFLYTNVSYRLPSFYLLFLLVFISSNNNLKGFILGMVFLEPVIWHSEIFVRNIFTVLNNFSHYIVFLVLAKYIYKETYLQAKKLFTDLKNDGINYKDF